MGVRHTGGRGMAHFSGRGSPRRREYLLEDAKLPSVMTVPPGVGNMSGRVLPAAQL